MTSWTGCERAGERCAGYAGAMSRIDNIPPSRRGLGRGAPFPKGTSPNPGGRPKAAIAMAKLIRDSTRDGAEVVEFMLAVLRGDGEIGPPEDRRPLPSDLKDGKSRRWAAEQLLDRGFGKAPQTIEIAAQGEAVAMPDMSGLPLEELRRIAAGEDAGGDDPPGNVH